MIIKLNKKKIKILLIISFVICLSSINTIQNNLINFFFLKEKSFFNYLNFVRFIAPTLIIVLLSFLFSFKKKFNKLLICFFIYGIWQVVIFTIENSNPLDHIVNYQLILNSISILLIFFLADHYNLRLEKKLLIILIIYISLISLFFYAKFILEFFNNKNLFYFYATETLQPESENFAQTVPRVTGLARMFVIIFYFLFFLKLSVTNNFLKKIILITSFFLMIAIYATQTRGAFIGISIFIIYYLFFFKHQIIKKVFYIFFIILIPIVTFESIIYLKSNYNQNLVESNLEQMTYLKNKNRITNNYTSSGRIDIWKTSIKIIKEKKIILGKGPQADRLLLSENQGKSILKSEARILDNNSSNALIYSYLCGGILSFTMFLFIYFFIIKKIFIHLFVKKVIEKKIFITNFALITLIFLTIRTVFENGYAVFGIDYVFCITCYFVLLKPHKEIKKN
jgi:hypothetical protein